MLTPLIQLTGKNSKWEWKEEHNKAFNAIKCVVAKETMLAHPNFRKKFETHADASDCQSGAAISQENKPIAFFSRKLTQTQKNMTVTEKEPSATVETPKELRNVLLGHPTVVHADHKNLTHEVFNTQRVMRWRLVTE